MSEFHAGAPAPKRRGPRPKGRRFTSVHLKTLRDLPEALEALGADMREALVALDKSLTLARSLTEPLGAPVDRLAGIHVPDDRDSWTAPSHVEVVPPPDPGADEARAAAEAMAARRRVPKEVADNQKWLQGQRAQRDALVTQLNGGEE